MQALIMAIMLWISADLGLPSIAQLPGVEFVPRAEIAERRLSRITAVRPDRTAADRRRSTLFGASHDVHAFYDDGTKTIVLPEDWMTESPVDVSILVHELVHHMQNLGGIKYECAAAREKLAYRAQSRWLELFGKTLEGEFEIDPMTVLVRTNCMF